MKLRFYLLLFSATFLFGDVAFSQISGTDVFLQGVYLEIGQSQMGAFGTCASPAGYHPHECCTGVGGTWTTGAALGEVYDWGHDGWSVGSPAFMGDYTEPGYPFEGWSLQIGTTEYRNWVAGSYCAGDFEITGSNTSYSNVGGNKKAIWTGSIGGINIISETRVDTFSSAVVVTVRFYNTTATPITHVFYERTCDPDNVSTWTGGSSSTTHNVIVHQNDDADHRVLVSSCSDLPASPATYNLATYMGLGTKDCRAVCTFFGHNTTTYGLTPDYAPDSMWNRATSLYTYSYAVGDSDFEDIGYAIIFNIGTLAPSGTPGDSAIISLAYVYNTNSGLDSAFPEPTLVVNSDTIQAAGPAPTATYDTFNTCSNPGVATVPVTIAFASDKCWSWSTWTWSPSIGLASTTGVNNTINVASLSSITTYTITGTDSAVNMLSCAHRVMYLTILPCLSATSNSPGPYPAGICLYDTLKLQAHGDSTGATYEWFGPSHTLIGTGQYIEVDPPLTLAADTGWYTVYKTIGSQVDSAKTYVILIATPVVTATSNSPVCSGTTLDLFANPDSAAETFSWTGPNGFISGLQNPTITSVPVKDSGWYEVRTDLYGCIDSGFVHVQIDSAPVLPNIWSNSPGAPGPSICQGDTLELFSADSTPGVSFAWTGPLAFTSSEQNPVIVNAQPAASGNYTVTVTLNICSDSAVATVNITPTPVVIATNNGPICTGIDDTLLLQAVSVPGASYTWTGPYVFYSLNQNPYRTPVIAEYGGIYQVRATANGCPSALVNDTVIVRQTPNPPVAPWLTFCQDFAAPPLQAMGDSVLWYPVGTSTGVPSLTAPVPSTSSPGITWYYITQTLNTCTSAIDSTRILVNPKPSVTVSGNTAVCPHDSVVLTATDVVDPIVYYHWSPPTYLSDVNTASVVSRPENDVHYMVVATNQYGCTDSASVNVTVYAAAVLNLGDSVTLYPGESYQINPQTNCVTFAWFPPAGLSADNIADPLATPQISTKYIVHGQTSWGCFTIDSLNITIDPTATLAIPNAFTPGNGPNNEFKIIKRGIATLNYFRVFDRWGVKVFETTDIDKGWDGSYKGTPQPFDVYVYEISAVTSTGTQFVKRGNVTLIR